MKKTILTLAILLLACSLNGQKKTGIDHLITQRYVDSAGKEAIAIRIGGKPPALYRMPAVTSLPPGAVLLNGVPAYEWSFGCAPTSAAMMAGYYDQSWYPNMYSGPINGGLAPMNNSLWGYLIQNGDTLAQCPFSATRDGLDGRTTRGHVDDYWIKYDNTDPDPYITNGWTQHVYGGCTGDFMYTSQSAYGIPDGATGFGWYGTGWPKSCNESEHDGSYGLKQFFLSRGYPVEYYYNQLIDVFSSWPWGFSFNQYTQEIDAGRPVLLLIEEHVLLGCGYNPDGDTVYVHDTWDYDLHKMVWGGHYDTLLHYAVAIVKLAAPVTTALVSNITCTTATCGGNVTADTSIQVTARGICWSNVPNPNLTDNHTVDGWGRGVFSSTISGLDTGMTYFVRSYATSSLGTVYGNEMVFTTSSFYIGQAYGGGVIFYLNSTGDQGLIVAPYDQATGAQWGCNGTVIGTSTAFNAGPTNTTSIVIGCSQAGTAARICDELLLNGYDDWFLPSKDELNIMYQQKAVIPNLGTCSYWSSSEGGSTYVWVHNLFYGFQAYDGKTATWNYLRAIRAFPENPAPATRAVRNVNIAAGQTKCYDASQAIVVAGGDTYFKLGSGGSATLVAGQKISFLPGTHVCNGGYLRGYIAPGGPYCTAPATPLLATTSENDHAFINDPILNVFPNPTTGNFSVQLSDTKTCGNSIVNVYNVNGERILTGKLYGTELQEFTISYVPQGIYYVQVINGASVKTAKLIRL